MSCCKSASSAGSRVRTSNMRCIGTFEAARPRSLAKLARGWRLRCSTTRDDWSPVPMRLGSACGDCAHKRPEYSVQTTTNVARGMSESLHLRHMVSSGSSQRAEQPPDAESYIAMQGKWTAEFTVRLCFKFENK